jgi:hypothetical protein
MSGPIAAIILTVVVHFIGAAVLVWAMAGKEALDVFRTGGSDDGRGGRPRGPAPLEPEPTPGLGVPMADADLAAVRLREPGRIAEGYQRRPRRPEHVPAPAPARERELV